MINIPCTCFSYISANIIVIICVNVENISSLACTFGVRNYDGTLDSQTDNLWNAYVKNLFNFFYARLLVRHSTIFEEEIFFPSLFFYRGARAKL